MASLAASYIVHTSLVSTDDLLLVTFGQPRTGNTTYAQSVDQNVSNAYRVVHSHDPIPHLPGKGHHGYWHHKSEVFYNENMGGWVICEEDEGEKCSGSVKSASNFYDHLHYFDKDILGLGYSNCQNSTGSS
uniref:Lipase_3 domain-containing protein n=1 Tax=Caenorhabditis japonica TaxID=281687 RepID=A0A8R1DZ85_CAEJA